MYPYFLLEQVRFGGTVEQYQQYQKCWVSNWRRNLNNLYGSIFFCFCSHLNGVKIARFSVMESQMYGTPVHWVKEWWYS